MISSSSAVLQLSLTTPILNSTADGFRFEHRVEVRGHLFVMMKQATSIDAGTSIDQEL